MTTKSKTYSTIQAARRVGISRATIMRWLKDGEVAGSIQIPATIHRWTDADIAKLQEHKEKRYWQGGGRPVSKGAK